MIDSRYCAKAFQREGKTFGSCKREKEEKGSVKMKKPGSQPIVHARSSYRSCRGKHVPESKKADCVDETRHCGQT